MSTWIEDHVHSVPSQIEEFLAGDEIRLEGKKVLDIGCGDGLVDAGIAHYLKPKELVGVDINDVDLERLDNDLTKTELTLTSLTNLKFKKCSASEIPLDSDWADVIVSWSAFEHIQNPFLTLSEASRILKPDGVFFVQVYPLYFSMWGSHLEEYFPSSFHHLSLHPNELSAAMKESDQARAREMMTEYQNLNRITIDDFQFAARQTGLRFCKVELLSQRCHVPESVSDLPISNLAITGFKGLLIHK